MSKARLTPQDPIHNGPWDVVVVGAGAAGLMTCLELPAELNVLLLNRNAGRRSSSRWAQGGIASVTGPDDSAFCHGEDTLKAGAGLCDGHAVRLLVDQAPRCVDRLLSLGMAFDRNPDGSLATTLEAAHSQHRVLHVQDRTGRALVDVLRERVEARPGLVHRRGVRVTQLWVEDQRCCGVQVLDGPWLHWVAARAVVLATGGGGHLYTNTTNPPQACGEGVVLSWQAGAAVDDLEFVQFHPTALKRDDAPCFLISEAVRGEGAVLVDPFGRSPVEALPQRDLAPRDQVSRALLRCMRDQGLSSLGLDLSPIPADKAKRRFPTILERCREYGLDPLQNPIPVAPAAHYWMGGVATDLQAATTIPGLFAVGEVASTGVHGANRLASNSLMECLVFAGRLRDITLNDSSAPTISSKSLEPFGMEIPMPWPGPAAESLSRSINSLRSACWDVAGVDRHVIGMRQTLRELLKANAALQSSPLLEAMRRQDKDRCFLLEESCRSNINLLLDLHHRQQASRLLLEACLFRTESRGGHFRGDAPTPLPQWRCHSRQVKGKTIHTRPVID